MPTKATVRPGAHPHSDQANFTAADYLAMCAAGEATFSVKELARVLGVSRTLLQRAQVLSSIPAEKFDQVVGDMKNAGRELTTTAVAGEIRRRTGKARSHVEHCPHCGGAIRRRTR